MISQRHKAHFDPLGANTNMYMMPLGSSSPLFCPESSCHTIGRVFLGQHEGSCVASRSAVQVLDFCV